MGAAAVPPRATAIVATADADGREWLRCVLEHAGLRVLDAFETDDAEGIARELGAAPGVLVLGAELVTAPDDAARWLRVLRASRRLALAVLTHGEALPPALARRRSALAIESPFDGAAVARAAQTALARVRPVRRGRAGEACAAV